MIKTTSRSVWVLWKTVEVFIHPSFDKASSISKTMIYKQAKLADQFDEYFTLPWYQCIKQLNMLMFYIDENISL